MFIFPAKGLLLLTTKYWDGSKPALRLYDISSANPGEVQCVFTLPESPRGDHSFVGVRSGNSYRYHPSTFYTRPEDRILVIFVEGVRKPGSSQHLGHITLIIVFVSTLLRLAQSRRLVEWQELEQYAWVADRQQADDLLNYGAFISSSRIIHPIAPPKRQGVATLKVTTFRPSIIERSLYTSGDASNDPGCAEPRRLTGRNALLDVQVDNISKTKFKMGEDNIILMTPVRNLLGGGPPILTLQRTVG